MQNLLQQFFFFFQTVKKCLYSVSEIKKKKKTAGIHENSKNALLQITPLFCHKGYSYWCLCQVSYNNTHLQVGSVTHIFISHPPKIVQSTYQILLTSKAAKFNRKSFNESHTILANLLLLKKKKNVFLFFLPFRGETNTWSRWEDGRCSEASKHTWLTFTFMAV